MAIEITNPIAPPTAVTSSVSSRNCIRIQRCFAPRAILMPISRVRSSTTTFMMFETPMPPTINVSTPISPRNALKASMKMSKKLNCSVVYVRS